MDRRSIRPVGRLTFRIGDQEQQLTAFGFPGSDEFSLLFKDATNASTTYGFRILHAPMVKNGEWTVIDFNVAGNPPGAPYSKYTSLSAAAGGKSAGRGD